MVEVAPAAVFFLKPAAHWLSPTAGEVLIMLGEPGGSAPVWMRWSPALKNGAAFQWANDAENTAFLAHVVSAYRLVPSSTAGIALGDPMAWPAAPPLEATFGIDAAMKLLMFSW